MQVKWITQPQKAWKRYPWCSAGWFCAMVWLLAGDAWAANSSTIQATEAYATIHHMGLYVAYGGDDNQDASALVRYRQLPSGPWIQGHDLLRLPGRRWVGSLFGLAPAQEYEIEVSIKDADGAPAPQLFRGKTRADTPPAMPASGRHWYVDALRGKSGAAGDKANPLATIQAAADRTQPGDTVHVLPGIYRESVVIRKAGTATQPILYLAEGSGVILDGADATIQTKATWSAVGNGIYSTPFTKTSLYVAAGDTRLYDYGTLADLQAENGRQSGKNGILKGGFFVDGAAKKLYLRLPDRADPAQHKIHVAVLDVAVRLETTSYIILRGFELRYYGGSEFGSVGVDIRNSHHCWIQRNHIHHINSGIIVRKEALASENVIEDNHIRDTSVWNWPWSSVKAHTPEASAISITHGRGNVVRRNQTDGSFNGIYVGSFTNQQDESIARDSDIYDNQMARHGDDGLEPEGACLNVRFVRNAIAHVFNGISLAPIQVGPLWAIRTALLHYKSHALKLNNGSIGWMLIYHTTAIPDATVPAAQAMSPSVPFGGLISRNNIWAANRYVLEYGGTSVKGPISLDYDLLWTARAATEPWFKWRNVRYQDLAALTQGTGFEQHGIAAKPTFVDAAANDFRPAVGSPMLDKGTWLEGINRTTTKGSSPDIGAYEQGQALPPQEQPLPQEPPTEEPSRDAGPTEKPITTPDDAGAPEVTTPSEGTTHPEGTAIEVTQEAQPAEPSGQVDALREPAENPDANPPQEGPDGASPDSSGGCQCGSGSTPGPLWWVLGALCWLALGRKRLRATAGHALPPDTLLCNNRERTPSDRSFERK